MWGCAFVAASFHYMVPSPNLLHLGSERSACSKALGTLTCRTPLSTSSVSREQPRTNVCTIELRSLCMESMETFPSAFSFLSNWFSVYHMYVNIKIIYKGKIGCLRCKQWNVTRSCLKSLSFCIIQETLSDFLFHTSVPVPSSALFVCCVWRDVSVWWSAHWTKISQLLD